MPRRLRLLTSATAGLSAALLLAGCGGGSTSGAKGTDAKAAASAPASVSASASASTSAAADGRPKITLPADDILTFTPEQDSDPVKDAILKDNAEFVRALDAAIVAQNPRLPALEYYTEGEGALAAEDWVQSFKKAGWTLTRPVRYTDRPVRI